MSKRIVLEAFGGFQSFECAVTDWSLDFRQLDESGLEAR